MCHSCWLGGVLGSSDCRNQGMSTGKVMHELHVSVTGRHIYANITYSSRQLPEWESY